MITLYVKTECPYCAKAVAACDSYGVPYEEKNIADPGVIDELIQKGGKRQVPFLVDGEITMYESDDIVRYIEETYGDGTSETKPRVHVAGETCSGSVSGGCPV